jgi:M6 family metalloprotease-like protein
MKFSIQVSRLLLAFALSVPFDSITAAADVSPPARSNSGGDQDPLTIHSMPPNPEPYTVAYSDGTESPLIYLRTRGRLTSDVIIYEETVDGFTVKQVENKFDGKYVYVDFDEASGDMIDTGLIAGVDDPYSSNIHKGAATSHDNARRRRATATTYNSKRGDLRNGNNSQINDATSAQDNTNNEPNQGHRRTVITSGTLKNLVIPFKFSDHNTRPLPSRSDLDVLMNNVGPDAAICPTGSVRDVYLQNSFNSLDLESTVIDWVTLDYTESFCANGQSGLSSRIHTCLGNALDKAEAAGVDFSNYDLDNDNIIDGITFFHSGYAAEWGGTDQYGTSGNGRIWSHKWALFSPSWFSDDGIRVYEYHINPALWSTSGSNIGRIGVIAHETGHFLGLPDLYDYGDGDGIGSFGLMANSWGFDYSQYYPPLMSAWGKYELGWVTPTVVSSSGSFSLKQTCDNSDMIKISIGYPSGEYLLIENRQPCGFDSSMSQGGLAIFHIDDNANNNRGYPGQSGWPTNGNHYEVALLQADGSYNMERGHNRGDSSDLFRSGYRDSIGPDGTSSSSYPNTKAYQSGNIIDTEVTISNISVSGSTMTLDITIGSSPTVAPVKTPTKAPVKVPTKAPVKVPTKAPVKAPTKAPVKAPTKAPVKAPTKAPVKVPTKAPVKAPTKAPVSGPPTVCADNEGKFKVGRKNRTCKWVGKKPGRCNNPNLSKECPVTCKLCDLPPTISPVSGPPTACSDNEETFKVGKTNRTCEWAAKKPKKRCNKAVVSKECPVTCGSCSSGPPTDCADNEESFQSGNKIRTCEWAGKRPGKVEQRCAQENVSKECPVTCDSCI